jgi:hypothetical protein
LAAVRHGRYNLCVARQAAQQMNDLLRDFK